MGAETITTTAEEGVRDHHGETAGREKRRSEIDGPACATGEGERSDALDTRGIENGAD